MKSGFLNVNEACYNSTRKATTSTNKPLIIRCVFMEVHHQVIAIMHLKKLQLTMKSSLVQNLPRHCPHKTFCEILLLHSGIIMVLSNK